MTIKEELAAMTERLRGIKCAPSELNGHRFHQQTNRKKPTQKGKHDE